MPAMKDEPPPERLPAHSGLCSGTPKNKVEPERSTMALGHSGRADSSILDGSWAVPRSRVPDRNERTMTSNALLADGADPAVSDAELAAAGRVSAACSLLNARSPELARFCSAFYSSASPED